MICLRCALPESQPAVHRAGNFAGPWYGSLAAGQNNCRDRSKQVTPLSMPSVNLPDVRTVSNTARTGAQQCAGTVSLPLNAHVPQSHYLCHELPASHVYTCLLMWHVRCQCSQLTLIQSRLHCMLRCSCHDSRQAP